MTDQKFIKNVILDLGGVLIDIEPKNTYREFKRILRPETFVDIDWDNLPEVVEAMETGKWSKEEFKKTMLEACLPTITATQMVDAWCAMLMEFKALRVRMVQELNSKYNVYLLSNTNVYHVDFFEKEFKNRFHFKLKKLFKKVYYSHEIGFRKPDIAAFEFVLNDAGLIAEETVMVDDREDNCLAAEKAGMQSILVPNNTGLEKVIKQLL
ncbi:MAG TPA: HAD family phosphatase [Prolixibacteraceae bacterium]|nr:HAD family phosphatase [Prolixibacteraceae bacterium]HPR60302.1 HAD family phosphatase [Prolixibacteraceae bacterium]